MIPDPVDQAHGMKNMQPQLCEVEEVERRVAQAVPRAVQAGIGSGTRFVWRAGLTAVALVPVPLLWPAAAAAVVAFPRRARLWRRAAGREVLIVVNKADYLRPAQREAWAAHFRAELGLETAFFSARQEQAALDAEAEKDEGDSDEDDNGGDGEAVLDGDEEERQTS